VGAQGGRVGLKERSHVQKVDARKRAERVDPNGERLQRKNLAKVG